jgi:hypothetical protein
VSEVEIRTVEAGSYGFDKEMFIATVVIDEAGGKQAAGLGHTENEALRNLVEWLAGAALGFDENYVRPEEIA